MIRAARLGSFLYYRLKQQVASRSVFVGVLDADPIAE